MMDVVALDVLPCPRCPGRMELIAPIDDHPSRACSEVAGPPLPFDHAHGLWQDRRTVRERSYPRCAKAGLGRGPGTR